jgi:hypothetical protein
VNTVLRLVRYPEAASGNVGSPGRPEPTVTLDPSVVRPVAAGHRDGGLQYYDGVTIEHDGWTVGATGFYPIEAGRDAPTTLDLSRFLVRSLTIRHEVRG